MIKVKRTDSCKNWWSANSKERRASKLVKTRETYRISLFQSSFAGLQMRWQIFAYYSFFFSCLQFFFCFTQLDFSLRSPLHVCRMLIIQLSSYLLSTWIPMTFRNSFKSLQSTYIMLRSCLYWEISTYIRVSFSNSQRSPCLQVIHFENAAVFLSFAVDSINALWVSSRQYSLFSAKSGKFCYTKVQQKLRILASERIELKI